jgi:ParB-like nuclease family protein
VKDLGVLQPIRAVRTSDGSLRVEFGHRRTLAAIEAGFEVVSVLVVADEQALRRRRCAEHRPTSQCLDDACPELATVLKQSRTHTPCAVHGRRHPVPDRDGRDAGTARSSRGSGGRAVWLVVLGWVGDEFAW